MLKRSADTRFIHFRDHRLNIFGRLRGIPAKSYPVLVWSDDVQGAPCVQRFIAES